MRLGNEPRVRDRDGAPSFGTPRCSTTDNPIDSMDSTSVGMVREAMRTGGGDDTPWICSVATAGFCREPWVLPRPLGLEATAGRDRARKVARG